MHVPCTRPVHACAVQGLRLNAPPAPSPPSRRSAPDAAERAGKPSGIPHQNPPFPPSLSQSPLALPAPAPHLGLVRHDAEMQRGLSPRRRCDARRVIRAADGDADGVPTFDHRLRASVEQTAPAHRVGLVDADVHRLQRRPMRAGRRRRRSAGAVDRSRHAGRARGPRFGRGRGTPDARRASCRRHGRRDLDSGLRRRGGGPLCMLECAACGPLVRRAAASTLAPPPQARQR